MSTAPNEMPIDSFQLTWGGTGSRIFETGVDRGVVYIDDIGYAWTGLVAVNETPEGGTEQASYLDGIKQYSGSSTEDFKATIEAYTYPDEFMYCDGSAQLLPGVMITQQGRKPFNFSYRTHVGNDVDGLSHAYKIHIVYNAIATPTSRSYHTLQESGELATFSWTISTRREKFISEKLGTKYSAHLVVDSRTIEPATLIALENVLYGYGGASGTQAKMPSSRELFELFGEEYGLPLPPVGTPL